MNIEEAIKKNKKNLRINKPRMYPDFAEAIQLGIEALERLTELRTTGAYWDGGLKNHKLIVKLLPSETEEIK